MQPFLSLKMPCQVQMHEIAHTTGGDPLIVMEFCPDLGGH